MAVDFTGALFAAELEHVLGSTPYARPGNPGYLLTREQWRLFDAFGDLWDRMDKQPEGAGIRAQARRIW